ncbi:hypothetical protein F2D83_22240 [Salmonella enterica]|nr:hypothetical protein [Salmonella enterica]
MTTPAYAEKTQPAPRGAIFGLDACSGCIAGVKTRYGLSVAFWWPACRFVSAEHSQLCPGVYSGLNRCIPVIPVHF